MGHIRNLSESSLSIKSLWTTSRICAIEWWELDFSCVCVPCLATSKPADTRLFNLWRFAFFWLLAVIADLGIGNSLPIICSLAYQSALNLVINVLNKWSSRFLLRRHPSIIMLPLPIPRAKNYPPFTRQLENFKFFWVLDKRRHNPPIATALLEKF